MALIVKDLIEILATLPPHAYVIVSSDAEGNQFRYLDAEPSIGVFDDEENEFYSDDFDDEATEEDEPGFGPVTAIALWPED